MGQGGSKEVILCPVRTSVLRVTWWLEDDTLDTSGQVGHRQKTDSTGFF